jgi:hypothetical protein
LQTSSSAIVSLPHFQIATTTLTRAVSLPQTLRLSGSDIDLNGMPATVVGVLPASFDLDAMFSPGTKADLFEPAILDHMRTLGGIATMIRRR